MEFFYKIVEIKCKFYKPGIIDVIYKRERSYTTSF